MRAVLLQAGAGASSKSAQTQPEEWPELSSGYRIEIERMQREILDYLVKMPPSAKRTTAA